VPSRSLRSHGSLALSLILAAGCAGATARSTRVDTPQAAVDDLLAADRAFSAAASQTDAISAIAAMLAADVTMPAPRGQFARGPSAVAETLRPTLGNTGARVHWTPVRGGVSADVQQGFTFGYMTLRRPDTAAVPLKYLAYWVKQPSGWRVAAYKVTRRPQGDVSLAMMQPALPARLVSPTADLATIAKHYESLIVAEGAFSDRAQQIGLGPAFVENGSADAMNMGGANSASFVIGSDAIGRSIGAGAPQPTSPVTWGADRAIVASSGDLGVTFGVIRPNAPPPDAARPAGFSFFTVWRRPHPTDPWRYVAE
jgi:ketosteroid isomerase-like protein